MGPLLNANYMSGPMMNGYDYGWGWLAMLTMLVVWVAIIGIGFYAIRSLTSGRGGDTNRRDPLDIARERYARGEITKEELAEIKKELK